jgi:hypothetical protein
VLFVAMPFFESILHVSHFLAHTVSLQLIIIGYFSPVAIPMLLGAGWVVL